VQKELKGPHTLSRSACTREKRRDVTSAEEVLEGIGSEGEDGWCRRVGGDMGNTSPKFGVRGMGCEVWRTKCSEGHGNRKMNGEEKKTQIRQKEGLKKNKTLVTTVLAGFDHLGLSI
jgi:hypothetical protein